MSAVHMSGDSNIFTLTFIDCLILTLLLLLETADLEIVIVLLNGEGFCLPKDIRCVFTKENVCARTKK